MRESRCRVQLPLLVLLALLAQGSGCQIAPPVPPPEAVLEGTWDLTTDDEFALTRTIFVFDQLGRISEMRSVFLALTITDHDVHSSTEVSGSDVTIITTTNLIFHGTFNEDFSVATGKLSTEFTIPFTSTVVSIDKGDATLTKQQ